MYSNTRMEFVEGGKLMLNELHCRGIALEPGATCVGHYPITAIINGERHRPVCIQSGGVYTHPTLIESVEVDVAAGGGVDGDEWRLTLKDTEADGIEGRYPCNVYGRLETAPASGVLLFDLDSRKKTDHFIAMLDGSLMAAENPADPYAYELFEVSPENPHKFTSKVGPAWDVTPFRRIHFGIEAGHTEGSTYIYNRKLNGFVRGYGRSDSAREPMLAELGCGTKNEFGTASAVNMWDGSSPGSIMLGAGLTAAQTEYRTVSTDLMPYLRFILYAERTPSLGEGYFRSGMYWIRIFAMGLYT